jgi:putative flippase GtrA
MIAILQRIQSLAHNQKAVRYIISGVASEIIEYGSFFLLLGISHWLVFSNSLSFILGITSGFVFHKLWSFAGTQQFKTHQQAVAYAVVAVCNFFVVNLLIVLLVDKLHWATWIAKLLTMALTAAWSFCLFNFVIFRHSRTDN